MSKRSGKEGGPQNSGGFLSGLAQLLNQLQELAETGGALSRSDEFTSARGKEFGDKEFKGVYGFNVRVGLGGEEPKVEPFGNIKVDRKAREGVVVQEVRETAVDVLEEGDHVLIVAEMPGVSAADVKLEVHDDVLTLAAAGADKKYRKEILLPGSCPRERMTLSCNNGIVKIRCPMK
jgi:HSP20 family protein